MTRRILIECGAAETRAALIDGERVLRFWFGPARGDELLARPPHPGQLFLGRIRTVSKPLKGAFVDLGEGPHGFLPAERTPPEGAPVVVAVRRPAIGGKGPLLTDAWKKGLAEAVVAEIEATAASASPPSRLGRPPDAALEAATTLGAAGEIFIDRPDAAAALADRSPRIAYAEDLFEAHGAEPVLEAALERVVRLGGGARVTIDETEGVTAVDIDAGAAAGRATGRLNDNINAAAAAVLFAELSRRGIGGRVVVDFLPPSGAPARHELVEKLRAAKRGTYECRLGRLAADGLLDLTAPRDSRSLLDEATEEAGAGWLRPGRRFTLDWQAKAAIRMLERRLASQRAGRLCLFAGGALDAYVRRHPQWRDRAAARYGERFDIVADGSLEERSFRLDER